MEIDIEKLVNHIINDVKDPQVKQTSDSKPERFDTAGTMSQSSSTDDPCAGGMFDTVDQAILAAKKAQEKLFASTLKVRQEIITALREQLLPEVDEIARRAFEETGMGSLADKIKKNRLAIEKTPGVEDLTNSSRVITGDGGMTLYEYCPYGVIGSITPSTNPTETIINNSISMIAAGNSIYFSPHPGAKKCSAWLIRKMNQIISDVSGIDNLLVSIKAPSIEAAQEMMDHPEIKLLAVTGGPGVVSQAMHSGKKVIGAGAGNPPVLVDETANVGKAAQDIVDGASFDNNVPCFAEKNVIVVSAVAAELLTGMQAAGAYYISNPTEIEKIRKLTVTDKNTPNKKYVGRPAQKILEDAGVSYQGKPRLILIEADKNSPFAQLEMLMPVLPFIRVQNYEEGLATSLELEHGLHHTAIMHSRNVERLAQAARLMQTTIFVKNGPSYVGIGYQGEGPTTFTIATPTGEGPTTARTFARIRRCALTDGFSLR